MKNKESLTKNRGIHMTILLLFFSLLTVGCPISSQKDGLSEETDLPEVVLEKSALYYFSDTKSEDCFLCGDGKGTLLPVYRGQENLGVINLNTLDLAPITINRYDDFGVLIEEPENGSTTHVTNMGEDSFFFSVTVDTNRGYARGQLAFSQNETLEMEKVASHLCSDCLKNIMNRCWSDMPLSMGVINFGTGEIRLFEENILAFTFGDYYISCDEQSNDDEEKEISLLVFYCPERYSRSFKQQP